MIIETLSKKEIAVLLSTRCSENAQSEEQLSQNSETLNVKHELELLCSKGILEEIDGWDGEKLNFLYSYADNSISQLVYEEINGR